MIKVAHASVADAAVFALVVHVAAAGGGGGGGKSVRLRLRHTHVIAPAPLAELLAFRFRLWLLVPQRVSDVRKRAIKAGGERDTEPALT